MRGFCLALLLFMTPAAANEALDVLVAAYPDHLAGYEGTHLIWKDGTRTPHSDGSTNKSFEQLVDKPNILDQFAFAYPLGPIRTAPGLNQDPGRIRNEPFFLKLYGDCRKGEVDGRLESVKWMSGRRGGSTLRVTNVNGVADKVRALARDLEELPDAMMRYLIPSAGTYNCRPIAGTNRLSVHGYGAAIDLNAQFGDYWLWGKNKPDQLIWKNRIPPEIVEIFERHGFIWGGKWYHFDTFHFEYRPELIEWAKRKGQIR